MLIKEAEAELEKIQRHSKNYFGNTKNYTVKCCHFHNINF